MEAVTVQAPKAKTPKTPLNTARWLVQHSAPNRASRRQAAKINRPVKNTRNKPYVEPVVLEAALPPGCIVDGGLVLTDRPAFMAAVHKAMLLYDQVYVKVPDVGGKLQRVTAGQKKLVMQWSAEQGTFVEEAP